MTVKVLIAHAKGESELAEQLAEPITTAGYEVHHGNTVMVGESEVAEACKLLGEGVPVVLCGTARAVGSKWARQLANAARALPETRLFIVQMEDDADLEVLAYGEKIAHHWQDPSKAMQDLLAALRKHFPLEPDRNDASSRPSNAVLRDLLRHASTDLLAWRTTLPNDQWLERPELQTLLQCIASEADSLTLLLGEPGCGKSALLARLGKQLQTASIPVLGIKLDFLPESIQNQHGLKECLGLPMTTVDCVRALAQEGKVVVLVDQLDALADLVVQHSGRLRVPLELIRDLAELENVHVVASCRVFEHRHDPRLRNLEAAPMMLALPAWEKVDTALQAHQVQTAVWNENMREVLRSPHALDTFLRLLKTTDETELLQSYQHILESLWKQAVLCAGGQNRRRLLLDLTDCMANREVLWLPLANFEDRYSLILELVAAGILTEESGRIGFRHQTLFEFSRARTFLETGGRLTEVVLARQGSLRLRPQVWHALTYMRAVDRQAYLDEIRRLWNAELRPHLRMLLIEFLGKLENPEPAETALFFQKLDDAWHQGRILSSVIGSRGWFEALAYAHLPMLMVKPAQEAWRAMPILANALTFDQSTVLQLLHKHWLPYSEKDGLSWQILEHIGIWQVDLVELCCRMVSRNDISDWNINYLAGVVSLQLPDEAPRIIAAWIKREWEKLLVLDNQGEQEESPFGYGSASHLRFEQLLQSHSLHDLPALAEAAPAAFLDTLWPWFVEAMERFSQEAHPFVVGYRQIHGLMGDIDPEEEIRIERPFITAIIRAIEKLAEDRPAEFISFAKANEAQDLLIVQCLLAKGMTQIASSYPDIALEFLCADPRRLVLGSYRDAYKNTKVLIRNLVPHLTDKQVGVLEEFILSWNRYFNMPEEDAKTRFTRLRWAREHRLRLVKALPQKRMSDNCRRHVEQEERAFPNLHDWDSRSEGGFIGSPVSAEQMQAARDEDVLNLFSKLTDEHGWDHPKKPLLGGAIQAGRELAKLAEKEPERAVQLILKMRPGVNEIPAGYVIDALVKASYDCDLLYQLILSLADNGFTGEHFRHSVSWALEKAINSDHPLPDRLFSLLESWLIPSADPGIIESQTHKQNNETQSLLWGVGHGGGLPGGNFPTLAALSIACLRIQPHKADQWLGVLERHLLRNESPRVWLAVFRYLKWLHLANHKQAQTFINNLFISCPSILDSSEGVVFLAHCQRWIEPGVSQSWLKQLSHISGETAAQGLGELLMLRRAWFPEESWIADKINEFIHTNVTTDNLRIVRIGLAHAASHLWNEPQHRQIFHGYLLELIKDQDESVLTALTNIFLQRNLPLDQATRELLDALCQYPAILNRRPAEYIGECLEPLIHWEPERVYNVCNALIDVAAVEMANPGSSRYLMSESLVTIALTLQDLGGVHQTHGTALFERMLEFNVPQAQEVLTDLDMRTPKSGSSSLAPRRRWKKRKPT